MSLLFQCWFCPQCGYELCGICHENLPTIGTPTSTPCVGPHCKAWFYAVSVFSVEDLQDAIKAMELVLTAPLPQAVGQSPALPSIVAESTVFPSNVPESTCEVEERDMRDMERYQVGELSDVDFMRMWSRREPFVLVGVVDPATPDELFDLTKHKAKRCTVSFYDDGIWNTKRSTLGAYFKSWSREQSVEQSLQIRVCASILC